MPPPDEVQLQVNFRMPSGLKDRLQRAADQSGRTLTAEIVHRLDQSFEAARQSDEAFAVLEDTVSRISLMQRMAENYLRWQRLGWTLFAKLADLAGDRLTPEVRQEMHAFRSMPFLETKEELDRMARDARSRNRK